MLVLKPDYYKKFKCIGDKCPNTCCKGWNVEIDDKAYIKYSSMDSEYGKYILSTIKKCDTAEKRVFIMDSEGRCPHLSEKGLCNIYTNASEDYMCLTCKTYPRIHRKYINMYEELLVASCPEVARIIVENKKHIEFEMNEEELKSDYLDCTELIDKNYDEDFFDFIFQVRSDIIDIFQMDDYNLVDKCLMIATYGENAQAVIGEYNMWQAKISQVKDVIASDDYLQLINTTKDYDLIKKISFLKRFLKAEMEVKNYSKRLVDDIVSYSNDICKRGIEQSVILEDEFNDYFNKKFENVYENYAVYLSYRSIIRTLNHNNIYIEVLYVFICIIIIQMQLFIRWIDNSKSLTKEDIQKVIYNLTRIMEHNEKTIFTMLGSYEKDKVNLYDVARMIMDK